MIVHMLHLYSKFLLFHEAKYGYSNEAYIQSIIVLVFLYYDLPFRMKCLFLFPYFVKYIHLKSVTNI